MNKTGSLFLRGTVFIISLMCLFTVLKLSVYGAEKSSDTDKNNSYKGKTVILMSASEKEDKNIAEKIKEIASQFEKWGADVLSVELNVDKDGETNVDVTGDFSSLLSLGGSLGNLGNIGNIGDASSIADIIADKGFSNVKIIVVEKDTVVEKVIEDYRIDDGSKAEEVKEEIKEEVKEEVKEEDK